MNNVKRLILILLIIPVVSGCALFQSEDEGNLIDTENLNEGSWIGFTGEHHSNSEYVYTESIDYNPSNNYILNRNAYISYFNDDDFLKTVQHAGGNEIDTVEDANNIVISFNRDRIDIIELIRE